MKRFVTLYMLLTIHILVKPMYGIDILCSKNAYDDKMTTEKGLFPKPISDYLTTLSFGGTETSYDSLYNTYMFPLALRFENVNFLTKIEYETNGEDLELYINSKKVENNDNYDFPTASGNDGLNVRLELRSDTRVMAGANICFTFLPIVEITGHNFDSSSFGGGTIRVMDPDNLYSCEACSMKARYRGASSLSKQKKSYAVKLVDQDGNKTDRGFFGLRSDNNWILDAMAVDHARMRNRVSTDLWLDYSVKPYYHNFEPNLKNGTRGRFVELILNKVYAGLYCMTEKVDRKQLKLKKHQPSPLFSHSATIRGELYKAVGWSYGTWMGFDPSTGNHPMREPEGFSNDSPNWGGGGRLVGKPSTLIYRKVSI